MKWPLKGGKHTEIVCKYPIYQHTPVNQLPEFSDRFGNLQKYLLFSKCIILAPQKLDRISTASCYDIINIIYYSQILPFFLHPACREFFHFGSILADSRKTVSIAEDLCWACAGLSYGYSFEPRPNSRGLAGSVMTIGLLINRCSHSKKPVWREKTRLTGPEVRAAATSKAWCDSHKASFSPLRSRRRQKAQGRTLYDGLYGEAPPEMGTFFRLQGYVYERVGTSLVEVEKMVGKSVIWVCERAQKG